MIFDKKERTIIPDDDQQTPIEAGDISAEDRSAALEAEVAEANDMLLRRTAELENMRRRHQNERTQLIFEANKHLITQLLPTIDDLERTLSFVTPEEKSPLTDGIELMYRNFQKVLEQHGVKPIESVGQQFDVHLHDALMEEIRTDVEPGTITTEVQKGYHMHDTVLRHAKVIVAKGAEE
jgi:molecular chaperone GrpE